MPMQFNSAVRMIDPTRNTSKSPTTSENASTVGLPTRHHQHHANRLHERDEAECGEEEASHLLQVWWKGHSVRLCPSADDCQDVDEVGTEPSSDADSDQFGLERGDDPIATINSVTERNDRTRGGKELLAFVDSGAVDNVLTKSVCTEYLQRRLPSKRAEMVLKGRTGHTSSTMGSDALESRQALGAI